ncbi:MAG: M23 family metallopeptidase [Flavobacteriales bacterium]|nr:M23 family metallopeptidase [Flavobacteriales bacterium]
MKKFKYRFDPHNLQFVHVKTSTWILILRVFGFLSASVVAGFLFLTLAYSFMDSPKEKLLRREIDNYKLQLELLDAKSAKIQQVMKSLEERDDKIYREIFGASPISPDVRKVGIGGSDRYRSLRNYENGEAMIKLHETYDQLYRRLYVQSKSYDELIKLAKAKNDMLMSIPAIQPVANKDLKRVASGYGSRIDPIYRTRKFHAGMDFTAPVGTPVTATGDGVVQVVESKQWGYGKSIVINHGYGYKTRYAHLSKFKVRAGQKVSRGEVIGFVGNTGKSTGPHLHYEVIKNKSTVNPANYYYNDLTPEQYEAILKLSNTHNQSFD